MTKQFTAIVLSLVALSGFTLPYPADSNQDTRELVEFPAPMKAHMLSNMRDHLAALDEILGHLAADELDAAARIAEYRLGMSSLDNHGAEHMGKVMPPAMGQIGTQMHRAASRFALTAQEGDALAAYAALKDISAACVACHAGYRVH